MEQKFAINVIDRLILDPAARELSGSKYKIGRTPQISKNVRNARVLSKELQAAII